jgi:hypothetical protein
MALRAITAKGVAVGAIVAVLVSASLLLRLPRRSANPAPVLAAHALPAALVPLSDLPLQSRTWIAPEPPDVVLGPAEKPVPPSLLASRTLATALSETQSAEADADVAPLVASRPIVIVLDDVAADEQVAGETTRKGAVTRAMDSTGRAFRVAGTSVASAFRKVF